MATFIIDCPHCKAKVGVEEKGRAENKGFDDDAGEPYGERLTVGSCPSCGTLLAGYATQTHFDGWEDEERDRWSDAIRVYPKPSKTFSSYRIPVTVKQSLLEGDKSMQAGASMAACVMFGRALEAVCRDILLDPKDPKPKHIMLGQGIQELKAKNIIDQRLFDWSQQLQAFRNIAAHPEGTPISREDAEDLEAFVHAIIEYIYDLADRYEEFKARLARRQKKKP